MEAKRTLRALLAGVAEGRGPDCVPDQKGREVRLNALRARWRQLFGDANFVVED